MKSIEKNTTFQDDEIIDEAHRILETTWGTIEIRLTRGRNTQKILNQYISYYEKKLGIPVSRTIENKAIPGMYHLVFKRNFLESEVHSNA